MIHALRSRLSWQSVGALCLLFAINAVALVLLLNAISNQKNAANYAQRAEQAVNRRSPTSRWSRRASVGVDAGANDHMRKPFSPQELVVRVRSMLGPA